MIMLAISAISSIIGIMGIVTSLLHEWFIIVYKGNIDIPSYHFAIFFSLLLYLLFLFGKHKLFLRAISVIVAFMGVCFIMSMILADPDPVSILKGLIPNIPQKGNSYLVISGIVGTTMAAVVVVSRSILVKEREWKTGDLKIANRDMIISMSITFILSLTIMASAAATLFQNGISINDPVDMVRTLEPLAGRLAISIFVFGIICAGLSSIFPNILLIPWLFCDYFNKPRNMLKIEFRIIALVSVLTGLIVPIWGGKPIVLMIASQAISPLMMPLLLILLIYLINNSKVVGQQKPGLMINTVLIITLLFSLFIGFIAVIAFMEYL